MAEHKYVDAYDDLVFDPFGVSSADDARSKNKESSESDPSPLSGNSDITKLHTEDDKPVILVHTVQRESGTVTPKNLAKRGLHSVKDFVLWIIGAVIISLIATFLINSVGADALASL